MNLDSVEYIQPKHQSQSRVLMKLTMTMKMPGINLISVQLI